MTQQQYGHISKALWVNGEKKTDSKVTYCDSIHTIFYGSKIADTINRSAFGAWGEGRRGRKEFEGKENILSLYYDCVDN